MVPVLAFLFFITGALYAAVGFGGGSTYTALLVLSDVDYRILPLLALSCNIIVVTGGVFHFGRSGHLSFHRALPFLFTSVPAAWIGGRLEITELFFVFLLGVALLITGLQMLFENNKPITNASLKSPSPVAFVIGATIGLLAGLVGIGGGIFLAPILYRLNWGTGREIAAMSSIFILANSVAGLSGQLTKLSDNALLADGIHYWPLVVGVLLGGNIGSWLGSRKIPTDIIKKTTAVLILYVSARLIWRGIALTG